MFKSGFAGCLVILLLAVSACEFKDPFEADEGSWQAKEVSFTQALDLGGTEVEVIATDHKKDRVPRGWGFDVADETAAAWVMVKIKVSRRVDIRQFKLTDWSGKKTYLPHRKSEVDEGLLLFMIPQGEEVDWKRHRPKLMFEAKDGKHHGFIVL